tara:strand:- start:7155 stop:7850 length:696 start_codon:yes stop_codon:yes gene_type:complete
MRYIVKDVEALYPRVNQTYRFDAAENRSVPCDPQDDGASYELQFRMTKDQAKDLMTQMATTYAEKRDEKWPEKFPMPFKKDDDGMYTGKAKLKGAYGKELTKKPKQYDANNKELPEDFLLTTGSTVNLQVTLAPYSMQGAGVSLRLNAIQVIKYMPMQTSSPFEKVDGFTADIETSPFEEEEEAPKSEATDIDDMFDEPVKEPKKVVKLKATPKESSEAAIAAALEGWDDE